MPHGPSEQSLDACLAGAGNYDTYLQVRSELEDAQMKKHKWEQDQISHMKVRFAAPSCHCKLWSQFSARLGKGGPKRRAACMVVV